MQIKEITAALETWAPLAYQESYDNAGLIIGDPNQICTGILCSLDCTEAVIEEAIAKGCNLIVSHHPIIFRGIKQFNPNHYVTRTALKAIHHQIALYAIHTNLDNLLDGVNQTLADRLGLLHTRILDPKRGLIDKNGQQVGAGIVGQLAHPMTEVNLVHWVKETFQLSVIRHTAFTGKLLNTIALCGGAGSFLTDQVIAQGIDCFVSSDFKYHEFFEADGQFLLLDIGHGESEQYVPSLILAYLTGKFPTFAVLHSEVKTQPISYLK